MDDSATERPQRPPRQPRTLRPPKTFSRRSRSAPPRPVTPSPQFPIPNSQPLVPRPGAVRGPHPPGRHGPALNPKPSTLNPQPSTLNPQPSTLNPQPSTLTPRKRRNGDPSRYPSCQRLRHPVRLLDAGGVLLAVGTRHQMAPVIVGLAPGVLLGGLAASVSPVHRWTWRPSSPDTG